MRKFVKHDRVSPAAAMQNPCVFADEDAAYVLGFSVIMLNTDAHSSQVKRPDGALA